MGLFKKKECENGNELEKKDGKNLKKEAAGYIAYAKKILKKKYTDEELEEIMAHRDAILERYRSPYPITVDELKQAAKDRAKLSDDECRDIILRLDSCAVYTAPGASYCGGFFLPHGFAGTVVDTHDVYAVGMTTDRKLHAKNSEVIMCAVFTEDPYIPVFPMVFSGKVSFGSSRSKKGREDVGGMFSSICPNLLWEPMPVSNLKKKLKEDKNTHGGLSTGALISQISSADSSSKLFDSTKMLKESWDIPKEDVKLLERFGFIPYGEAAKALRLERNTEMKFWDEQIKKAYGEQ